ncbi:MAG: Bug family tripartite tricarboxylate transporter substrate binding protein [Burkholderiales bacterium]
MSIKNLCVVATMVVSLMVVSLWPLQGLTQSTFPSKPLRIVTVLPAGNDGYIRAVATKLSDQLGQPVVVDNRPGAGGVTAAQSVSTAAPDGHALMIIASAFLIAKAVNPKLAYEPLEDFAAVAKIYGGSSSMVLVRPESPAKTLEQLLAQARATPEKFSYGVGGIGGQPHLSAAALLAISGIKALHVPFKTQNDVALALLRGDVDFTILATTTSLPLVQTGKFRVLAVTSGTRFKGFPDVPTVHEIIKNDLLIHETWAGLAAPAKTPGDLVRRLHAETSKALVDTNVRKALAAGGNEPTLDESVDQFAAFLRRENDKWREIVKLTGVKAE